MENDRLTGVNRRTQEVMESIQREQDTPRLLVLVAELIALLDERQTLEYNEARVKAKSA